MAQNRGAGLLDRLPDVDLIVGTQKFHRVPDYLDNLRAAREAGAPDRPRPSSTPPRRRAPRTRSATTWTGPRRQVCAFVSIQQGCDMHCAFCIVPTTRGDERSRPMDDIVARVRGARGASGAREITLLGQIVTSYGRRDYPHDGRRSRPSCSSSSGSTRSPASSASASPPRIPRGFRQDLADAFARLPKLGEYVHLPVQSGSDRILRAMKRPYTRERYLEIVRMLRAAQPAMAFSTDIIVGFPGETDADFEETRTLCEEVDYDMAYIFKYSVRTGTPAATMPDQVPDDVKEERNQVLLRGPAARARSAAASPSSARCRRSWSRVPTRRACASRAGPAATAPRCSRRRPGSSARLSRSRSPGRA